MAESPTSSASRQPVEGHSARITVEEIARRLDVAFRELPMELPYAYRGSLGLYSWAPACHERGISDGTNYCPVKLPRTRIRRRLGATSADRTLYAQVARRTAGS